MIFSRRAIQRMLNEVKPVVTKKQYTGLVRKLNVPGPTCLPTMWEVAVLAQFAQMGTLVHEAKLPNDKRPDIKFQAHDGFSFVADVTTVSDRGVDQRNPYAEFSEIIEEEKRSLGLQIGGVNLDVREQPEVMKEGTRRRLRLPPHDQLREYVRSLVLPELQRQLKAGQWPLLFEVDDEIASFRLKVTEGPHSVGSYGSYELPTIVRQNPLFYQLQEKAGDQLREVPGIAGIIACDGDCASIQSKGGHSAVSTDQIVKQFLADNAHIAFVMILTVKDNQKAWPQKHVSDLSIEHRIWVQPGIPDRLRTLLAEVGDKLPKPVNTSANAALRAVETGFGRGHGTLGMNGRGIQIGARHLMEVLAGRRSVEDFNRDFGFRNASEAPDGRRMPNPFERALSEGRLRAHITIEETGDDGRDHVMNIEFGDPDPALSELR